jgi:hypothetical protein
VGVSALEDRLAFVQRRTLRGSDWLVFIHRQTPSTRFRWITTDDLGVVKRNLKLTRLDSQAAFDLLLDTKDRFKNTPYFESAMKHESLIYQ